MWSAETETLAGGSTQRITVSRDSRPAAYGDVIDAWREDAGFREVFVDLLTASPYPACYWETPPVSAATRGQPFECVLIESTLLAGVRADRAAFTEHFDSPAARDGVVAFPNLGHDALLIAPCPASADATYAHLAAFARSAPREQQHALWSRLAAELDTRLTGGATVWVSTAGQGVYWLHIRLDTYPKYYNHGPYIAAGDRQRSGTGERRP